VAWMARGTVEEGTWGWLYDLLPPQVQADLLGRNYCPSGPLTVPMKPVLLSSTAKRSSLVPAGMSTSIGTIMPRSRIC
jgi:hypothetical protein